jgi:hypothetical protein
MSGSVVKDNTAIGGDGGAAAAAGQTGGIGGAVDGAGMINYGLTSITSNVISGNRAIPAAQSHEWWIAWEVARTGLVVASRRALGHPSPGCGEDAGSATTSASRFIARRP